MTAQIIDGKATAKRLRQALAAEVAVLKEQSGKAPGLATVLVGDNPASATYVRSKIKACEQIGMLSVHVPLAADISQADLEAEVEKLNNDPAVHGILVQLPLPKHIDEQRIIDLIRYDKDVDGFHPLNIAALTLRGRDPLFVSCTPAGCMLLLEESGVNLSGAEAVIVGRSNIVGMPMALLLVHANATVTVTHSRTKALAEHLKRADIVIAAVGRAEMITGDMLKPGCVVIDVGINTKEDATRKRGYRLVGDVAFESAKEVASAITPVPGGVGPMTIAMLMQNTVTAFKRDIGAV